MRVRQLRDVDEHVDLRGFLVRFETRGTKVETEHGHEIRYVFQTPASPLIAFRARRNEPGDTHAPALFVGERMREAVLQR